MYKEALLYEILKALWSSLGKFFEFCFWDNIFSEIKFSEEEKKKNKKA